MKKLSDSVFGISNTILEDTYVDRRALDAHFQQLLRRKTHIAIKGPSKSGKSWLRQKILNDAQSIVIQCRLGYKASDIYEAALGKIGVSLTLEETKKDSQKGQIELQASIGTDLTGKISGKTAAELGAENTIKVKSLGHDVSNLYFVASKIISSGKRLIIEDSHYLSPDERKNVAYDLKALWDYGCFVIIVGIWGESNLFIHANSDLAGRIEEISLEWLPDDLRCVITKGEAALNIKISRDIQNRAIKECFGSVGLLQRLMLRLLDEAKIHESQDKLTPIVELYTYESAAMAVAEQLNGVYQKFADRVASGIRTRNDSTGIYAHAMAAIIEADDISQVTGISVDKIFSSAHEREPRIQKSNLKSILLKIDGLQIDTDGRGLVVTYIKDDQKVLNVDRQLLFYRKYLTISWPWEELIVESKQIPLGLEDKPDNPN